MWQHASGEDESIQAEPRCQNGECLVVCTASRLLTMTFAMSQIRGLSISDALAQVQFSEKKVAKFIQTVCPVCPTCEVSVTPPLLPQTLLDTQRRAAEIHNVEPTNLHVGKNAQNPYSSPHTTRTPHLCSGVLCWQGDIPEEGPLPWQRNVGHDV